MSVQAFITSGILEKHVLGMTSKEETQEVLEMASQHLEIKEELAVIRQTMKSYILSHQVAPPPNLKERATSIGNKQAAPTPRTHSHPQAKTSSNSSSKKQKESSSSINIFGIASFLLGFALIGACFTAYTFFKDVEISQKETAVALEELAQTKEQLEAEQKKIVDLQNQLGFYHDRDNDIFLLNGTSRSPGSKAIIYWNAKSKTAFLDLADLPSMREGSVAVLWVGANRRSNKVGVLTTNPAGEKSTLTYFEDPDLFYVTEEVSADVERPNRARILMTGGI